MTREQMAINRLMCGNTAHSCKADYIKLAIKALEKQVPKKPEIAGNRFQLPICPVCNYAVMTGCYCGHCGQKLDLDEDKYDTTSNESQYAGMYIDRSRR